MGISLLMLAENIFPPIPSEIIMPFAGFVAGRGQLTFIGILLAGTIGSLAGALFWYWVGRCVGHDRFKAWCARHGRWLTLSPAEVDRASAWFLRSGWAVVFMGRLVPGVRTLISVPAGVAGMPLVPFLLATTFGTLLWTGFLAGTGYVLAERYLEVGGWIKPAGNAVFVLALGAYGYRVVTFGMRSR